MIASATSQENSRMIVYFSHVKTIDEIASMVQLSTAAENMVKKQRRSVSRATSCRACEKNPQTAAISPL